MQKTFKMTDEPWHIGTHLSVLRKSYPMNTNMRGLRWVFKKSLHLCDLDESSLSIIRGKMKVMKPCLASETLGC